MAQVRFTEDTLSAPIGPSNGESKKRHKGSIVDMEDDIDTDVELLEQETQRSDITDDLDFVNLDQLGNTIAVNKSINDRKHAITDILNGTIKHHKGIQCIDQCIKLVLDTWTVQQLKTKQAEHLFTVLQEKKYKMTIWDELITYFYDKPSYICSKIIRISKRIGAMQLILDYQRMVHLPNSPKEWSILLDRLQKKGQSLHITQRVLLLPMSSVTEDEDEPNTELKYDGTISNESAMFAKPGNQIDETVNGVTASDALQDILLKHRKRFKKTDLYKQMSGSGGHHGRGSTFMKSILKGVGGTARKTPNYAQGLVTAQNDNAILEEDDNNNNDVIGVEIQPLTGSRDESESATETMTQSNIKQIKHERGVSGSLLLGSDEMYEKLRRKWENPKCAGCGHIIYISFDGKDKATKQVITYNCKFVQDLDETFSSSLIYFHDKHCENLRKYKECIRKYVLESQLTHNKKHLNNMKNYVKNLLNHKDLLINIDSGELPRPAKILENEQKQFLSFITGGLFKQSGKNSVEEDMKASLDIDSEMEKQSTEKLSLLDIGKQRDIAVRLLTRGDIIKQTFQKSNIKMYHNFVKEAEDLDVNENVDNDDVVDVGIFDDIPRAIQYADSHIFGEPLFKFVVQQLLSKQTTALWRLLAYISMQIPTVDAISLLNEHQSDLAKAKKMEHLELVCTSIIQASAYPIASALHLSGFMSDLAENDLSREQDFREVATRYINIAENLVEYVESDHLLALLLEVPTDIDQMNVFDIAIQFGLDDFFDNNRVDRVITHMHQQFDFLNPNLTFRTKEMSTYRLVQYMINSPSKFYYTPVGKWWTAAILYILYVVIVSIVCLQQSYLYTEITGIEWIMWIANAGYITYEITEMLLKKFEYFSEVSNLFDTFISINWLFLGFLRFLGPLLFPNNLIYGNSKHEITETLDFSEQELHARNKNLNIAYMFFFGIQMCLLYIRFTTILSRSRKLGPFVRMITTMISDILNFSLIVILLSVGFTFALSFVIGPDKDPSIDICYDSDRDHSTVPLSTIPSIGLYIFQVLLGQQEWSVTSSNDCLNGNRSRLIQLFIMIFSVLGTVLLLNLLIAMMASTYENRRQSTSKDVNFSRTEETYQLAHKNALISAPFNIVAYAISLFLELITIIVIICSAGKYVFDIFSFVPVSIDYNKQKLHSDKNIGKIHKNCKKIAKCCCTFIRRVEDLADKDEKDTFVRDVYFNYGDGGRRFCRYCRTDIKQSGDIDKYFELFINYRLDEDDVKLMKRLMHGTGVCGKCYRPYKISNDGDKTDRLQRWEIQLEIISYYVFRIFVHIPMILILLLPALFGGFSSWITSITKDSHKITKDSHSSSGADHAYITSNVSSDEHYRSLVQKVINNELQQDIDLLSTQIETLDKKFQIISNQQNIYNDQLIKITNLLSSIDQKLNINDNNNNNNHNDDNRENSVKGNELAEISAAAFHDQHFKD